MILLALDPATRTGWAYGPAGSKPEWGAVELKESKQPHKTAHANMGLFLLHEFITSDKRERPDLVVYEAPLTAYAWMDMCKKIGRPQNGESLQLQHALSGAIETICGAFGIRTEQVQRRAVVKHFTGKGDWGGRDKGKNAVLDQAKRLNLMPLGCRDDDAADAIANFDFASQTFCRKAPKELVMFGEEIKW